MGPDSTAVTTEGSIDYVPLAPGANPNPDYYRLGEHGEKVEITRSEYKEWRGKNFTVKHRLNPTCGHPIVPEREPRHRNCESCWFMFFQLHGEFTQACDEVFSKFGVDALKQLRGPKLTKNFLKFMSTVARWKKESEASTEVSKENDEQQSVSGLGSTTASIEDTGSTSEAGQGSLL